MKTLPSIDRLNDLFLVHDGKLIRRRTTRGKPAGSVAGCKHVFGYWKLRIDWQYYLVHRIIFAIANNRHPIGDLDHINGDRADNRPENLREATHNQNAYNRLAQSNSKSGVKGVCWATRQNKWIVTLRANGVNHYLGYYEDLDLAMLVRSEAERKYHGEFARQ